MFGELGRCGTMPGSTTCSHSVRAPRLTRRISQPLRGLPHTTREPRSTRPADLLRGRFAEPAPRSFASHRLESSSPIRRFNKSISGARCTAVFCAAREAASAHPEAALPRAISDSYRRKLPIAALRWSAPRPPFASGLRIVEARLRDLGSLGGILDRGLIRFLRRQTG